MQSLLLLSRALIGVSQAALVVFLPLWVDQVAPAGSRTTWLALVQASVPIGVMCGYLVASLVDSNLFHLCYTTNDTSLVPLRTSLHCWRLPFLAQAALLVPFIVWLFTQRHLELEHVESRPPTPTENTPLLPASTVATPSQLIDELFVSTAASARVHLDSSTTINAPFLFSSPAMVTKKINDEDEEVPLTSSPIKSWFEESRVLVQTPLYRYLCLALCSLFFIVTGVQYYGSLFLELQFAASEFQVRLLFIATASTAPLLGVVVGGRWFDSMGGYRLQQGSQQQIWSQRSRTLKSLSCLGAFGSLCGGVVCLAQTVTVAVSGIWLLLFFGAACLPAAVGLLMSSVPSRSRTRASSFAIVAFNLLGYFAAPTVTGLAMQFTSFATGFKLMILLSLAPVLLLICAYRYSELRLREEMSPPPPPPPRPAQSQSTILNFLRSSASRFT